MEQICQLSKSVSCPPQALAYQAHLSLSCPCLLISMCISLSLSPKGKTLGPTQNANHTLGLYTSSSEHWKRVKEGQSEPDNQSKNVRQKNRPHYKTIILIYLSGRISEIRVREKLMKGSSNIFHSYNHRN